MPLSPIEEDSNFIYIFRASIRNKILCWINGVWICHNKVAINHSLCCTFDIWNLTLEINVLNLWSKSQTDFVGSYLMSLISVIHCDLDFGFLNSALKPTRIWLIVSRNLPHSYSLCSSLFSIFTLLLLAIHTQPRSTQPSLLIYALSCSSFTLMHLAI